MSPCEFSFVAEFLTKWDCLITLIYICSIKLGYWGGGGLPESSCCQFVEKANNASWELGWGSQDHPHTR